MSVKDRIKMVEQRDKEYGNEQLLKTFSATNKTEDLDQRSSNLSDSIESTESTDTENFPATSEAKSATTATDDAATDDAEDFTSVKDRVSSIIADLRAQFARRSFGIDAQQERRSGLQNWHPGWSWSIPQRASPATCFC